MPPEAIITALAGVISTLAITLFRQLQREREECRAEASDWKRRYFRSAALTEMALDDTEDLA